MKNKGERGSVTLFVLGVGLLVMIMLMAFVMKSYEQNQQDMEKAYARALEKNQ